MKKIALFVFCLLIIFACDKKTPVALDIPNINVHYSLTVIDSSLNNKYPGASEYRVDLTLSNYDESLLITAYIQNNIGKCNFRYDCFITDSLIIEYAESPDSCKLEAYFHPDELGYVNMFLDINGYDYSQKIYY